MRESFSLVTREALAGGVPVIASDSGGPLEVVASRPERARLRDRRRRRSGGVPAALGARARAPRGAPRRAPRRRRRRRTTSSSTSSRRSTPTCDGRGIAARPSPLRRGGRRRRSAARRHDPDAQPDPARPLPRRLRRRAVPLPRHPPPRRARGARHREPRALVERSRGAGGDRGGRRRRRLSRRHEPLGRGMPRVRARARPSARLLVRRPRIRRRCARRTTRSPRCRKRSAPGGSPRPPATPRRSALATSSSARPSRWWPRRHGSACPAASARNGLGRPRARGRGDAAEDRTHAAATRDPVVLAYSQRHHDARPRLRDHRAGPRPRARGPSVDVRLRLGGHLGAHPALAPWQARIQRVPFVPWHELFAVLAGVDVQLAPLRLDDAFSDAKSEVKYLEAGALGVPTVASPTAAFRRVIVEGRNGLLAASRRRNGKRACWRSSTMPGCGSGSGTARSPTSSCAPRPRPRSTRSSKPSKKRASASAQRRANRVPGAGRGPECARPRRRDRTLRSRARRLGARHGRRGRRHAFRFPQRGTQRRATVSSAPRTTSVASTSGSAPTVGPTPIGSGAPRAKRREVPISAASASRPRRSPTARGVPRDSRRFADSAGRAFYAWIESDGVGADDGVTLWTYTRGHGDKPPGGLHLDHAPAPGSLTFRTFYGQDPATPTTLR